MKRLYLPTFRPEDYDTFRGILNPDLPDTYDEWFKLHTNERLNPENQGEVVVEIEIYPYEFTRFCDTRQIARSLKSLGDFAIEKASRQQD